MGFRFVRRMSFAFLNAALLRSIYPLRRRFTLISKLMLQVRERVDSIHPTLHKLWETLTKILVIVDAALLVLAIDFRLVKSIQGLDCRGADPAILSDMSSHAIYDLLEENGSVSACVHVKVAHDVSQVLQLESVATHFVPVQRSINDAGLSVSQRSEVFRGRVNS